MRIFERVPFFVRFVIALISGAISILFVFRAYPSATRWPFGSEVPPDNPTFLLFAFLMAAFTIIFGWLACLKDD